LQCPAALSLFLFLVHLVTALYVLAGGQLYTLRSTARAYISGKSVCWVELGTLAAAATSWLAVSGLIGSLLVYHSAPRSAQVTAQLSAAGAVLAYISIFVIEAYCCVVQMQDVTSIKIRSPLSVMHTHSLLAVNQ
jgi:hypothetical protein